MLPFHLKLGFITLGLDQLLTLVGTVLGGLLIRKRLIGLGVTWGDLFDLILAALVGGAVGSKLIYVVPLLIRGEVGFGDAIKSWSQGSAFFGALLGGSIAICLVLRSKKLPVFRGLDIVALVVPIGFALGKIGCFLGGCCYGAPCPSPPGIVFPKGSPAGDNHPGVAVHPTQLYEFGFAMLLFAILYFLYHRSKRPGETWLGLVIGYSSWRFLIEMLRDDPDRHAFGVKILTDAQVMGLILIPASIVAAIVLARRPVDPGNTPST